MMGTFGSSMAGSVAGSVIGHGVSQAVASAMGVTGAAGVRVPIARNVVKIDEAHFNSHVLGGTYATMASILRAQGYVVGRLTQDIAPDALAEAFEIAREMELVDG